MAISCCLTGFRTTDLKSSRPTAEQVRQRDRHERDPVALELGNLLCISIRFRENGWRYNIITRANLNTLTYLKTYREWSIRLSECGIRCRIRRNQAIDLIALKLRSKTVKPASKQVSRFRMLFTGPLVFTIDTSIRFLLYSRNRTIV